MRRRSVFNDTPTLDNEDTLEHSGRGHVMSNVKERGPAPQAASGIEQIAALLAVESTEGFIENGEAHSGSDQGAA